MKTILIGDHIRRRREELHMTQEELARGICTTATLSRLEAGIQTPRRNRISALLQRLGLPDTRYFALNSPDELLIEGLQKDVTNLAVQEKPAEGFVKLAELEALAAADDTLTQQFILRSRALLGGLDGSIPGGRQYKMLMDAMHMTLPEFRMAAIDRGHYSFEELKILNQLAGLYIAEGETDRGLHLYERLLHYLFNSNQALLCRSGLLPMLLYNYACALCKLERYADARSLAEEGRRLCVEYAHYQYLPGLLTLLAECLHADGDDEKSAQCYREAYYLYRTTDRFSAAEGCRGEMRRCLGIEPEGGPLRQTAQV